MNILAAVASVESPTAEEQQQTEKDDDVEMTDADGSISFDEVAHNDIVLSLKDSTYKTIMYQYFRKLEETKQDGDKAEDEEIREEVFTLLKNAGGRLLKYKEHRKPEMGFIHMDDETARTSEYK